MDTETSAREGVQKQGTETERREEKVENENRADAGRSFNTSMVPRPYVSLRPSRSSNSHFVQTGRRTREGVALNDSPFNGQAIYMSI
jgi:hypothetical protein